MRYIITLFFLAKSLVLYSQITFSEVLAMEEKTYKEIQAKLLVEYTIIDNKVEYWYLPLIPCNPPVFGPDSCIWHCSMLTNNNDDIKSKYPLERVVFAKSSNKNYEVNKTSECLLAQNYNSAKKSATTFIKLKERTKSMNTNCRNELREIENKVNISIQFSDPNHWQDFKSSVAKNANFQDTRKEFEDSPVEFRYGIRRNYIRDGFWNGVFIVLYGEGPTYHANIYFDSLVD
jgi:hypothetical protein